MESIFFKMVPRQTLFLYWLLINHIVTQFFRTIINIIFSIHPMAPLEVQFMPHRLQKTILVIIVSFFKRVVIVSFSSIISFLFPFSKVPLLFHFLSIVQIEKMFQLWWDLNRRPPDPQSSVLTTTPLGMPFYYVK